MAGFLQSLQAESVVLNLFDFPAFSHVSREPDKS